MSITNLKLLLVALLLTFSTTVTYADKTVADLDGKDKDRYEMFRHLFLNGTPEEFYSFANDYAKELHHKGYMMLYYKLLCNKGFFALRHNQIYRAIQYAHALDKEVREDKASDYYYLATGLYGDIYSSSHDKARGETYFKQALEEVGDRDEGGQVYRNSPEGEKHRLSLHVAGYEGLPLLHHRRCAAVLLGI